MSLLGALEAAAAAPEKAGAYYGKLANPVKGRQSNLSKAQEAIRRASEQYRINPAFLWGIFGVETSYGSNIRTSSTGAKGPFQFEPATAAKYGYPLGVNEPHITDWAAFQQQANAAAHYLAASGGTHNPRGAIESYYAGHPGTAAGADYYSKVVAHARSYGYPERSNNANKAETAHVEEAKPEGSGLSLIGELGKLAFTAILLLAGAVLVVYGIMVGIRPPDRALSIPRLPVIV